MKNLNITKIEVVKETEFTQEAIIISTDRIPSVKEQNELFDLNENVVLEF